MFTDRPVLVTGATGVVGPFLVAQLINSGYRVRVLARSAPSPSLFPASVEVFSGRIEDRQAVDAAMSDVGAVFHLAAQLHLPNPAPELREQYERTNVEGTRCVVESANHVGVTRFVHFSTINVYGPSQPGQLFNESTALRPDSWYAETKVRAEKIALEYAPTVVLRLSAVYGPGMKGNYPRLLAALKRGRFAMLGAGHNRRTVVHVRDVATAALLVATHPATIGKVYNVTDGEVHELRAIIAAMSLALGRRPPRLYLPVAPVKLATGFIEDGLRLIGRRSPIDRNTIAKLLEDIAVSGQRLQDELGFHPSYSLNEGWREIALAL